MRLAIVVCGLLGFGNLAALLALAREWARERAALVQRIQAPQMAVTEHYNRETPQTAPPAVQPDSDEEFWESREALADRLAADEVSNG